MLWMFDECVIVCVMNCVVLVVLIVGVLFVFFVGVIVMCSMCGRMYVYVK